MGTIGDFIIDSVIMEENKIKGFAVYPLYGDDNFKTIRMVMLGHSLNTFRTEAHDLFLHNPTNPNHEFYKIIIEDVDEDGFSKIQNISDKNVLRIFKEIPKYYPLPGDAN